jgi:hypothetical protein
LFFEFSRECNISTGNHQSGLKNRGYFLRYIFP